MGRIPLPVWKHGGGRALVALRRGHRKGAPMSGADQHSHGYGAMR